MVQMDKRRGFTLPVSRLATGGVRRATLNRRR